MKTFLTKSETETRAFAQQFAGDLKPGDILTLKGNLGSGKTTFVQGLAQGLGIQDGYLVSSPTYTFINEYPCAKGMLYHMDFYRLSSSEESESLGLDQYFNESGISVVEWPENAPTALKADHIDISITWMSENIREIKIL